MTEPELPTTWTLKEIAAAFRVSEEVIYQLTRTQELPAFRVGAQWRVRHADVERFMARRPGRDPDAEITPPIVGDLLGVSRTKAWMLMRDGDISSRRVGRLWVTSRTAVMEYQARQAGGPTP